MTDITAELAALPKKRAGDVDSLLDFYEARLAIAERLLEAHATGRQNAAEQRFWDTRAYLAFRAKEQP